MQINEHSPLALTVKQFCTQFSISRTTFYEEVKARRLEVRKIGHKSIVLTAEAQRWLASLPNSAAREQRARSPR
ncbi:MAG: DNA-binding protein [Brevundimonas sp.]|uniref:hypothetical protein n=1 Tax=Brevundimonas sp. TaxID=1871086 RepID=UPI0012232DC6|nr:hypothetical protein [Brevundimonas sp.]RZJ17649.1 MAG: DNA-binding protein [Brevundimonas sp.]